MSFTCTICSMEIQVGEPMLADASMSLAHERCVQRELQAKAPPPPAPPSPQAVTVAQKVSGPGFGNPTASVEPCFMPSAPKLCVQCGEVSISICPYCNAYVHHGYGSWGPTCSLSHEQKCSGAKESRELKPKPSVVKGVFVELIPIKKNGRCNHEEHAGLKSKKKRRSR